MSYTKGKLEIERPCGFPYTGIYIVSHQANNDKDFHSFIAEVRQYREEGEGEANAERLVKCWNEYDELKAKAACHDDLVTVSHNLTKTMGIDYAIKKLSTMADDNFALGAATILRGIQRQAEIALAKVKGEK